MRELHVEVVEHVVELVLVVVAAVDDGEGRLHEQVYPAAAQRYVE